MFTDLHFIAQNVADLHKLKVTSFGQFSQILFSGLIQYRPVSHQDFKMDAVGIYLFLHFIVFPFARGVQELLEPPSSDNTFANSQTPVLN